MGIHVGNRLEANVENSLETDLSFSYWKGVGVQRDLEFMLGTGWRQTLDIRWRLTLVLVGKALESKRILNSFWKRVGRKRWISVVD